MSMMDPAVRKRFDTVRASPLYPQIQAMNRRLNAMSKQNNYREPVGNPEYDQLKSELFALRDQAAGGSPTPNMSQPSPFGERQNNPYTRMGGLGGLMRRFDPRRMSGGFPGMFGRRGGGFGGMMGGGFGGMMGGRRPPPFFGGGMFGGRRPFPGMYRGMPTFMNRMGGGGRFGGMQRSPWESSRRYQYGGMQRDRGGLGEGTASPFGGGFRPPFFQRSRPSFGFDRMGMPTMSMPPERTSYNPIPQIDPDAFRQFRQRVDQAPQVPQELIDAQMSSVQQGPPVAGGTGSLYGTPASQEEIDRMQTRMGGLGSIGGMMGGVAQPMGYSNMRIGPKARMMMNRR